MDLEPTTKMVKPFLSIQNISKNFGEAIVLKNISLDIFKYDRLAIIGQSGCGKTTLLRLIYGLLDKDGGQIFLENDRVKDRSEVLVPGDDRVKFVKQNYELFPDHTVYENIEHSIRFHKPEYIQKRIQKLLKAFDIEHISNKKNKLCSGGEQQRVAICCALAESPKLLLLDEPMAHLDPLNASIIKRYLWNFIEKERITAIYVTHSAEDALAYSNRIAVIEDGEILELGNSNLYQQSKYFITASLLGQISSIPTEILSKKGRKKPYLRPENWTISEQGHSFEVTKSYFMGKYYHIQALYGKTTIDFYHFESIEVGKAVNLSFDLNKVMWVH